MSSHPRRSPRPTHEHVPDVAVGSSETIAKARGTSWAAARCGEPRQVLFEPIIGAVGHGHDRNDAHDPGLIGHTEHCGLHDAPMLGEDAGHTMRVHPQTVGLEQVADATDEQIRAVAPTLHQAAGVEPAARERARRRALVPEIPRHDRSASDQELTDLTRRDPPVVAVAHLCLESGIT